MWRGFKRQIHDAAIEAATIAFPEKREQLAALSVFADQLVRLSHDGECEFVSLLPQRMSIPASAIAARILIDAQTIVSQNSQDNLLQVSLSTKVLSHAFIDCSSDELPSATVAVPVSRQEALSSLLSRISAAEFAFTCARFDVATMTEHESLSNRIVRVDEVSEYFAGRNIRTQAYKHLLCALDTARVAAFSGRVTVHDAYELLDALENVSSYHSVTDSTDGGTTIQLQILSKCRSLFEDRLSVRDS